jgi:hypothetical protein
MGNAVAYGKALQKFPRDAYSHIVPHTLARKYGFRGLYYVDEYPFSQPLAVLLDPAVVGGRTSAKLSASSTSVEFFCWNYRDEESVHS